MTLYQLLSLVGILFGVLIAMLAFFGRRLLSQVDTALAAAATRDTQHTEQMATLTHTLETTVAKLNKTEQAMGSLLRAFTAIDKWIYGEAQHGTFKNPPPDFSAGGSL